MPYGCMNRAPYAKYRTVKNLRITKIDGLFEVETTTRIPFVMSTDCQYTKTVLGQADQSCNDCKWRAS